MKRGFTLLELMFASSISIVVLAAVTGLLSAVWLVVKESSDEVDGALYARKLRERLIYNLERPTAWANHVTNQVGLINATNIVVSKEEVIAYFSTNIVSVGKVDPKKLYITISTSTNTQDHLTYMLDDNPAATFDNSGREFRAKDKVLQVVYLKAERGSAGKIGHVAYHDRIIVPMFGEKTTLEEIRECFVEDP